MKLLLPLLLAVLTLGCASTGAAPESGVAAEPGMADAPSGGGGEQDTRQLERKLEVANARLEIAKLEQQGFDQDQKVREHQARVGVEMAQARWESFQKADKPNRLASERLSLQAATDRAQEAAEELKQIELMYADQDLDDLTAEFVVSRGKRGAARAAARIEIQIAELDALEQRELPQEEKGLSVALDKAEAELAKAKREGEIGRRNKAIGVKEAENSIEKLMAEQAELDSGAKP